ncbi:MAG: hypothetical protein MI799_15460 [Desulfobacterales bacterium]|nr:hypothetical protein [Desulfobacterales bacterium]
MNDGIFLTFDMDGAPDYMLEAVLVPLYKKKIPATVFATGLSDLLMTCPDGVEIGLHPYIKKLDSFPNAIKKLKEIYPDARCLRSHGLVSSSALLIHCWRWGLKVTSNYLMLDAPPKGALPMLYGIHEYPICFMDDIVLLEGVSINAMQIAMEKTGLRVLTFHPVHIYLNACSFHQYLSVKGRLYDKKFVDTHVQNKRLGIRDLFISLLESPATKDQFLLFPESVETPTKLPEGYPA